MCPSSAHGAHCEFPQLETERCSCVKSAGTCGYKVLSPYDQRGEIGYDLARAYWGQGIMREALQAVIAYSFTQLDLNRIQAYVLTENARSIGLLRRLHFETEGVLREYRRFKGEFSDWVLMALLKKDWQS